MPLYKNNNALFFKDGTSLGDVFVINGLIHHASEQVANTYYYCDKRYEETAQCLYQDFPNIHIISDANEYDRLLSAEPFPLIIEEWKYVATEIGPERALYMNWERQLYEWCELPFSMRYKNFKLPKHIEGSDELYEKLTEGETDYVIAHKQMGVQVETRVEFNIEPHNPEGYKVIEIVPGVTDNLLHYVKLLQHAKQIHVLPSAVHALVDSIGPSCEGKFFLHDLRKSWLSQLNCLWNGARWTKVLYEAKV